MRDHPREPAGRNTAPAVALAALRATQNNEDDLLLVLAADHLIRDEDGFRQKIKAAVDFAEAGALVTFGVVPRSPETGYGYIKQGDSADAGAPGSWSRGSSRSRTPKPRKTTSTLVIISGTPGCSSSGPRVTSRNSEATAQTSWTPAGGRWRPPPTTGTSCVSIMTRSGPAHRSRSTTR